MGSKNARYTSSVVNRNSGGGDKKAGIVSLVGHPANVWKQLSRNTPTPGVFPTTQYGSTSKGAVGHR